MTLVEHKKTGDCPLCQNTATITSILKLVYHPDSKQVYYCHGCQYFFNEKGEGNTI